MKWYRGSKGWLRIIIIILPYLIVVGLFQLVGYIIVGVDFSEMNEIAIRNNQFHKVILLLLTLLATISVVWLFVNSIDKRKFTSIGLQLKNFWANLTGGMLLGVVTIALGFAVLLMLGQIKIESFSSSFTEVILSIAIYTLVSVSEEILCRGYILRNLMVSFNRYLALGISSIIFAILHIPNPNVSWIGLANLVLAGMLLGLPYIYTKNLWYPIGLHITWNLTQAFLGFNVSGNTTYSIVETSYSGSKLMHGGEFGFEGSLLCTLISIFAILYVGRVFYTNEKIRFSHYKASNQYP